MVRYQDHLKKTKTYRQLADDLDDDDSTIRA